MDIFRDMRTPQTILLVAVGFTLTALPVDAVNRTVKPADYSAIEKRNPFGLVDPPKPKVVVAPVEPVAKEPPPNVELTGMFHDSLRKKTYALFLVQVKGETKKRSYMLSEGEKQDDLKVEEIDRKSSNVMINLQGQKSTITYNEPKAATVAKPQMPQRPGARPTGSRANLRQAPTRQSAARQNYSTSGRPGNFGGSSGSVNAVAGGMNTPNSQSGTGLQSIPTRQMRTKQQQQQQPTFTRDEQEILIEAQRAKQALLRQENPGNVSIMPPLPPTSRTTPEDLQRIVVPPRLPGQ